MIKPILLLATGLLTASLSHAVTLATFNFDSGSLVVTTELFAGTTSDISFTSDPSSWSGNATLGRLSQDSNTNDASIGNDVNEFGFTYTVAGLQVGQTLNLTALSLDGFGAGNTVRYNTYVNDVAIGGNFNPPNNATYTGDLVQAATTGLENGDSVFISFAARDNVTNGALSVDNLILTGDVIPEPSSAALLGLAGMTLLLRRRRA